MSLSVLTSSLAPFWTRPPSPVELPPGDLFSPGLAGPVDAVPEAPPTMLDVFNGHIAVFIVAFVVTLVATPLMRKLAVANGIIDRPSEARKTHRVPVAYLGGVAVYLGLLAAVAFSYIAPSLVIFGTPVDLIDPHVSRQEQSPVPVAVLLGMTVIMLTGLFDDVSHLSPRIKIGGQLLAAAALAMQEFGTKVAAGVLQPIGALFGNENLVFRFDLPFELPAVGASVEFSLIYWAGVVIIAVFVLGACNASNLIDGLDGLLTGVTSIAAAGLLLLALGLAAIDDGPMDAARVTLALALLGSCLGFLPHNFNPATIFLGDAGSLLLGFVTIVLVLSLGHTGKTHLVVAGLIIFAIPIIDTVLAMVRRKMAGRPLSSPDDQHLHHLLKRSLGVKGAVFTLYGIGVVFAALGLWLSLGRVRVVMAIAMVIAAFIWVAAVKVARRQAVEAAAAGAPPPLSRLSGRPSVVAETQAPAPMRRPASAPPATTTPPSDPAPKPSTVT